MATFEKAKTVVTTRCHIKATPLRFSFALDGQLVPPGAICEVSMREAADLVSRGLAIDATSAEVAAAGDNIIVATPRHDTWTDAP